VTDTASSGVTTPTGTVSFTSSPTTGSFGTSGSCTLAGTGTTGTASCQLTFTPSAGGSYTITGEYGGDSTQGTSAGTASLATTIRPFFPTSLAINGRAKVSKKGVAAIKLFCSGAPGATCIGTLTLTTTVKTKVKRKVKGRKKTITKTKTITLGSRRYDLTAGGSESLRIALAKANVRLFDKRGHKLKAKATAKPATGSTTIKTVTLT
jgi:hypothetical protein